MSALEKWMERIPSEAPKLYRASGVDYRLGRIKICRPGKWAPLVWNEVKDTKTGIIVEVTCDPPVWFEMLPNDEAHRARPL